MVCSMYFIKNIVVDFIRIMLNCSVKYDRSTNPHLATKCSNYRAILLPPWSLLLHNHHCMIISQCNTVIYTIYKLI